MHVLVAIALVTSSWAGVGIPKSVSLYRDALRSLENRNETLERAYLAGLRAEKDLLSVSGTRTVIEQLDDKAWNQAKELMRGFSLNREEVLFVRPQPDFFIDLAKNRGTEVDQGFFALEKTTSPDGVWAAYLQQQTDASACRRYNGTAVKLYEKWRRFARTFPQAYAEQVRAHLKDIEDGFTTAHLCACEDRPAVLSEFKAFLKIAISGAREQARDLLKALEAGKALARYRCQSG
jgi:hypothetical protein